MTLLYGDLTQKILEACFEVSKELGSGFLESIYQNAMLIALREKGLNVIPQYPLSVTFRDEVVGSFLEKDLKRIEWTKRVESGDV